MVLFFIAEYLQYVGDVLVPGANTAAINDMMLLDFFS